MSQILSNPANALDVVTLNPMLEAQSPEQIVSWAGAEFGDGLIMTSSFGAESALLIHMATRVKPDIKIIFVDTGYLFPETHLFMEELRQRFELNVWTYRSRNDPIEYLASHGESDPTWRQNIEACCAVNKNEPFDRAMKELAPKAWLRGIRRDQSAERRDRKILEWSHRNKCYAVSPLLPWSQREMYRYMKQHDLPFHPLYEKGYASIGCNPQSCTRPIQIGEDSRAGRWSGQGKTECGLNLDSLDSAQL